MEAGRCGLTGQPARALRKPQTGPGHARIQSQTTAAKTAPAIRQNLKSATQCGQSGASGRRARSPAEKPSRSGGGRATLKGSAWALTSTLITAQNWTPALRVRLVIVY